MTPPLTQQESRLDQSNRLRCMVESYALMVAEMKRTPEYEPDWRVICEAQAQYEPGVAESYSPALCLRPGPNVSIRPSFWRRFWTR